LSVSCVNLGGVFALQVLRERRRRGALEAFNAERFCNSAKVAREPSEQVEVNSFADRQAAFQFLKLASQRRACADKAKLELGEHGRTAQVIRVQIFKVTPAPCPRAATVAIDETAATVCLGAAGRGQHWGDGGMIGGRFHGAILPFFGGQSYKNPGVDPGVAQSNVAKGQ
jgi:hypothetical protein